MQGGQVLLGFSEPYQGSKKNDPAHISTGIAVNTVTTEGTKMLLHMTEIAERLTTSKEIKVSHILQFDGFSI